MTYYYIYYEHRVNPAAFFEQPAYLHEWFDSIESRDAHINKFNDGLFNTVIEIGEGYFNKGRLIPNKNTAIKYS